MIKQEFVTYENQKISTGSTKESSSKSERNQSMPKLNQLLAVEKSVKENTRKQITECYQKLQKPNLCQGMSRIYRPIDDEGEKFPDEITYIQVRVEEVLGQVHQHMTQLFNVTLSRDVANCDAKADLVVDGRILLTAVPATYLIWLEKQLIDMHTIISVLPVLPADAVWSVDDSQNCYRAEPSERAKSKKIPKPFVKAEATKEHPAQVEVIHDDVVVGYWKQVIYSGAVPLKRAQELRTRIEKLIAAAKFAREQANLVETKNINAADSIFSYLLSE